MRYRIHFEHKDGTEDTVDISGSSVAEIKAKADKAIAQRGGNNPWSENLDAYEDDK
jgi:hypothetical protein